MATLFCFSPATRRGALAALVLTTATILGCSGGGAGSSISVTSATATPTASPSATPTEPATPLAALGPNGIPTSINMSPTVSVTLEPKAAPGASSGKPYGDFPPPPAKTATVDRSASGVVRITSAALGLGGYIEDVGIKNGEMETPEDASYAIGWYVPYDRPGAPGNAVFSAHETWNHQQGPFYSLYLAKAGDEIALEMANGEKVRYRVLTNARYDVDSMPTADVIWPKNRPANAQWITLITCGGRIVYDHTGYGEYLDRDVVVAQRIS